MNGFFDKYDITLYNNEDIKTIINDNLIEDPFYIIDFNNILEAFNKWNEKLSYIKIYYAVKCNDNPLILEFLSNLDCNFDCASMNEIKQILDITKDPDRIIYANPCKSNKYINYAKENNINLMTFDNIEELYKIKTHHPNSKLVLRIAVDDSNSICKFNIKFGCKYENIEEILKTLKILNLNLYGLSFHVGSGCNSSISYYNALKLCKDICDLSLQYKYNIKLIDIGGGFQFIDTDIIKFDDIADQINKGVDDFFKDNDVEFIAEPGRFMVEKSHTLILNVIGKKKELIDGVPYFNYYVNDGIYSSFNCLIFDHKKPIFKLLNEPKINNIYISKIFGPTCDSMDLIYDNRLLPELFIGDFIYIENFGAYTTSAMSKFNGFNLKDFKYIFNY